MDVRSRAMPCRLGISTKRESVGLSQSAERETGILRHRAGYLFIVNHRLLLRSSVPDLKKNRSPGMAFVVFSRQMGGGEEGGGNRSNVLLILPAC